MTGECRKLGVGSLTALVVGSMVGGGIFSLPQNIAARADVGAVLIGWGITAVGMLALAFVFQSLANRKPQLDGGVYVYAKAGTPKLRFQLLLWPVTDASFNNASYNQFAEGHFLTRAMMEWFWDNYTTDPKQRNEIHASPLRASLEQLKGLPPALVQTAEMDVLRDEGEAYARRLGAAGVAVSAVRYNGMIHDYGLLNVIAEVPAVRTAMQQAGAALREHLA